MINGLRCRHKRFFIPDHLVDVPLDELIIEIKPAQLGTNLVELKLIHGSKPRNFAACSSLKGYSSKPYVEWTRILARPLSQCEPPGKESEMQLAELIQS